MILLLLALQDTTASAARPVLLDIPFDLGKLKPAAPKDGDVIVVTARRNNLRLEPLPDIQDNLLPEAAIPLGGGKLGIVVEPATLPGGVTSNRVMLRWKLRF